MDILKNEPPKKIDNKYLFEQQKNTLDLFLSKNVISQEQYNKSLSTLKEKMNIKED